jgi:hypothetical protein
MERHLTDERGPAPGARRSAPLTVPLVIMAAACVAATVSAVRRPVPTQPPQGEAESLQVRFVKDRAGATAAQEARRAIVFVDAPYSVTAMHNGEKFLRGMVSLRQQRPDLRAEVYWVDNDADEWCKQWVASFGVADLAEVAVPVGHGAVLWLERGKVVRYQLGGQIAGGYEIKEATLKLW